LLAAGVPIFLFPEGTRSRNGGMGVFTPGAAALCISVGVPAVPVALVGAFAAWPAGRPTWKGGRPDVHVVIGPPMYPIPGEIAHEFNERLRRAVIELHDATALAYGMPTQAALMQHAAIEAARREELE
jgi:1-acyl-sn-glycerol-3-phosphate acyltransferase